MNARWIVALGVFEVVGAAFCVFAYAFTICFDSSFAGREPLAVIGAVVVASLSIVGGWLLLRRDSRGVPVSLVTQALQVVSFSGGFRYVATLGVALKWVIATTGTGLVAEAGGGFLAQATPQDGELPSIGASLNFRYGVWFQPLRESSWTLAINIVAALFLVRLLLLRARLMKSSTITSPAVSGPPAV